MTHEHTNLLPSPWAPAACAEKRQTETDYRFLVK